MSPALRGQDIPRGAKGSGRERTEPGKGEVAVSCPLASCDWHTVRPEYGAMSAACSHGIQHHKGMVPTAEEIDADTLAASTVEMLERCGMTVQDWQREALRAHFHRAAMAVLGQ